MTHLDLNFPDQVEGRPEAIARRVSELGLNLNGLAMRYYTNPAFKRGAFTNPDDPGEAGGDRADQARHRRSSAPWVATWMTVWLGQDGFDYNFQLDYRQVWDRGRCVRAIAEHDPDCRISLEYKPDELRAH
ncbi:MAG: hypothetical protein U1E17_16520 [Geminicoccaceae bacterium]